MNNEIITLTSAGTDRTWVEKFPNHICYRLQGRLGNQLFGLVNAHLIAMRYEKKIVLDISEVIIDSGQPVWLSELDISSWAIVVNDLSPEKIVSGLPACDMSQFKSVEEIKLTDVYCGFSPKIDFIFESALFDPGKFPFKSRVLDEPFEIALSIRAGDYIHNPHLGIIGKRYYQKTLKRISRETNSPIRIFTDDESYAKDLLDSLGIKDWVFSKTEDLLGVMFEISQARTLIGSNSTFSFWSAFFSKASTVYFPRPFYLAIPNWEVGLLDENWLSIKYLHFPKIHYLYRLSRARINRSLRRK